MDEVAVSANGDSGNTFKYDAASNQWIFNLAMKNLIVGKYVILISYTEAPGQPTILLHKYASNPDVATLVGTPSQGGLYSDWFRIS